jgi:hypothetical protein
MPATATFNINSKKYRPRNTGLSNPQRTWKRYGYIAPDSDFYEYQDSFISETTQMDSDQLSDPITASDYELMFPSGSITSPDNKLLAFYIEQEDTENLPAGGPFYGPGKILDEDGSPPYPPNVISKGATIVFRVFGHVPYDDNGGWEAILFGHSGKVLHRKDAVKEISGGRPGLTTYTTWTWDVVFSDYFEVFSLGVEDGNSYPTTNEFENASAFDIKVILSDEARFTDPTYTLFKDLLNPRTKNDKATFSGPPLLANNLQANAVPLGFDIRGTNIFHEVITPADSTEMAPTFPNLGPTIKKADNCKILGSAGKVYSTTTLPGPFASITSPRATVSVLEHIKGDTVPSNITEYENSLVGRVIRNREGTFRGFVTDASYISGGNQGIILDFDLSGEVDALTDGLLLLRYLFGLTSTSLLDNAVAEDAVRTSAQEIVDYFNAVIPTGLLDSDGNGITDALTDGLLLLRYLFGLTGESLVLNALAFDPPATRDAQEVTDHIEYLTSAYVQLGVNNEILLEGGQPIFVTDSSSSSSTNTRTELSYYPDPNCIKPEIGIFEDLYIELEVGETLNNRRNSGRGQGKNSSAFNLYNWNEDLEQHVTHLTSQDTTRPDSWIYHDFYGKPMLLLEALGTSGIGAYVADVEVKTTIDDRLSRKAVDGSDILGIQDSNIVLKDQEIAHNIPKYDTFYIVNHGTQSTVPTGYFIQTTTSQKGFLNATDARNPVSLGTHEGPYDDIEIFHIGGDTGFNRNASTNFQVQGYVGPTQEVTVSNRYLDYRKNERIVKNINMLPVGEIVLVTHDKDVNLKEPIEKGLNLTETRPRYIKIKNDGAFDSSSSQLQTFMSGDVVLPDASTINTGDTFCLFEHGGSGQGTWIGIAPDPQGFPSFHFRTGNGATGAANQVEEDGKRVYKHIRLSSIPEFDGKIHTVSWFIWSGADTVRVWIDNRQIILSNNIAFGSWSGGNEGGWGQGYSSIAGYGTSTSSPASNFRRRWPTEIVSDLRVYRNQYQSDLSDYDDGFQRLKYKEVINGNCRVKDIGGNQQLITPIEGGSRYRTVTTQYYNLINSPEEGDLTPIELESVQRVGVSKKSFQVEGVVRGVPLESIWEVNNSFLGDSPQGVQTGSTTPQQLTGTDGIRLTTKLGTTFNSTEEMEGLRGNLVNVEVLSTSGGSFASTAGPLKILQGKAATVYNEIADLIPGRTWYKSSFYADINNFIEDELPYLELENTTSTQANIDAGHLSLFINPTIVFDENKYDYHGALDSYPWNYITDPNNFVEGKGYPIPNDMWERVGNRRLKLNDAMILDVQNIEAGSDFAEYDIRLNIRVYSTENRETSAFVPDYVIFDSAIFVPDGTSTSWSAKYKLTVDFRGQEHKFEHTFTGTYKPEYGLDVLEPTGESRLNSNSKPLRFVGNSTGSVFIWPQLFDMSGFFRATGTQIANPLNAGTGIEDLVYQDPGSPYRTFKNYQITDGLLRIGDFDPITLDYVDYNDLEAFPLNNIWVETPANGNIESSTSQTIYVEVYYGGLKVIDSSYTGRINRYDDPSLQGEGTPGYEFVSDRGVRYLRGDQYVASIDGNKVFRMYDRYIPEDYLQPLIPLPGLEAYVDVNDHMPGNEDDFVVINNEPESMVAVMAEPGNNRYEVVLTDWPNDPLEDVDSIDRSNNYGRQDWHLSNQYAFQVLKVK